MLYLEGGTPVIISSEEGIHQGNPLGPALFAAAIHTNMRDLQQNSQELPIPAYLDDMFLLGPPDKTIESFQALKRMFCSINLIISDTKRDIFSPSGVPDASGIDVPVTCEGSMFLGTPIGSASFVESLCSEVVQSGSLLCDQLTKLDEHQSATLILRHCHVSRLDHLTQTVRPNILAQAASFHDSLTRKLSLLFWVMTVQTYLRNKYLYQYTWFLACCFSPLYHVLPLWYRGSIQLMSFHFVFQC